MLCLGCSRKNEVQEISVADSGIEIVSQSADQMKLGWPSWRGPMGNGVAPDQPLATKWSDSDGVRWRSDLPGRGHSSPIVVEDAVYLATATDDQQMLVSFDRDSGEQEWSTVLHQGGLDTRIHRKATHANGTIASDGKHLYIAFLNADRIVASAVSLDGEIVWQREIGQFVSKFGYAPSPVLYGSLVIFAADNVGGGYLAALDTESGEIAWRLARNDDSSYSSPTIAEVGGRDQLLISGGNTISSYDPATGDPLWQTPGIAEATCGTIVTTDELIFGSGGYPEKETVCLDANGKLIWSDNVSLYEPSMVIVGDYLVGITDSGVAYAWETETGEVAWRERLGGNFSSSPIVCNDLVYVTNLDGRTFVFSCDSGKYEGIAEHQLGDDCYASPAAVDGNLFMRVGTGSGSSRQEELICIAPAETAL